MKCENTLQSAVLHFFCLGWGSFPCYFTVNVAWQHTHTRARTQLCEIVGGGKGLALDLQMVTKGKTNVSVCSNVLIHHTYNVLAIFFVVLSLITRK